MTRFIARHSYRKPIERRVQVLEGQSNKSNSKITLEPPRTILLDEDGQTLRNNSLQTQKCCISKNIITALKETDSKLWYWEVTVASTRYTKIGYSMTENAVFGTEIAIQRPNETFGCILDMKEGKFKITNKEGTLSETDTTDKYKFSPCVELGPLQQITFNFGKPTLIKFNKFKLLSEIQCASKMKGYTCDQTTFRQSESLPFLFQEYYLDLDDEKKKKKILHQILAVPQKKKVFQWEGLRKIRTQENLNSRKTMILHW